MNARQHKSKTLAWRKIAANYDEERLEASFPAMLLDEYIKQKVKLIGNGDILDFGAGSGALAIPLAISGNHVTAIEPTTPMRRLLERQRAELGLGVAVLEKMADLRRTARFDIVLCINVLDHVHGFNSAVKQLFTATKKGGFALISVPHPLKDLGDWRKHRNRGVWLYRDYVLKDYLREGICVKTRENRHGDVIAKGVPSYHRCVSTYHNAICRAGFKVETIYEPRPSRKFARRLPILYSKASRIPYFLVFECRKPRGTL